MVQYSRSNNLQVVWSCIADMMVLRSSSLGPTLFLSCWVDVLRGVMSMQQFVLSCKAHIDISSLLQLSVYDALALRYWVTGKWSHCCCRFCIAVCISAQMQGAAVLQQHVAFSSVTGCFCTGLASTNWVSCMWHSRLCSCSGLWWK